MFASCERDGGRDYDCACDVCGGMDDDDDDDECMIVRRVCSMDKAYVGRP